MHRRNVVSMHSIATIPQKGRLVYFVHISHYTGMDCYILHAQQQ